MEGRPIGVYGIGQLAGLRRFVVPVSQVTPLDRDGFLSIKPSLHAAIQEMPGPPCRPQISRSAKPSDDAMGAGSTRTSALAEQVCQISDKMLRHSVWDCSRVLPVRS